MIPNVLKIFLENGQTKSFQYNTETTVKVSSACIKLLFATYILHSYKLRYIIVLHFLYVRTKYVIIVLLTALVK